MTAMNSQYLARAIQEMGAQPQSSWRAPDLAQLQAMKKAGDRAREWKAQNPGASYMLHNLQGAGDALMGAPQAAIQNIGGLMGVQARPQPGVVQQSLLQDGNAAPEFTIPEWARDGTPADHPGAKTYIDLSGMASPYPTQQPQPPAQPPMGGSVMGSQAVKSPDRPIVDPSPPMGKAKRVQPVEPQGIDAAFPKGGVMAAVIRALKEKAGR